MSSKLTRGAGAVTSIPEVAIASTVLYFRSCEKRLKIKFVIGNEEKDAGDVAASYRCLCSGTEICYLKRTAKRWRIYLEKKEIWAAF